MKFLIDPRLLASAWLIFLAGGFQSVVAQGSLPPEALELKERYEEQLEAIDAVYLRELEKLRTNYTKAGDVNRALILDAEIKAIQGTQTTVAAQSADIFLICDNQFEFCINGARIAKAESRGQVSQAAAPVKPGDIITVKARTHGGDRGFSCIIKRPGGDPIVTNLKDWKSYQPSSEEDWADYSNEPTRSVTEGTNINWKVKLEFAAELRCDSIWGPADEEVCYLIYKVPSAR